MALLSHKMVNIWDKVATLLFTIAKTFIGNPGTFKEKSLEILNNLKCKTLFVLDGIRTLSWPESILDQMTITNIGKKIS